MTLVTFAALFVMYNLGMVCRAGRDKQAERRRKEREGAGKVRRSHNVSNEVSARTAVFI